MNTNSHYKKFAGSQKKKKIDNTKNIMNINQTRHGVLPTHIKLNSPALKLSRSCNKHTYNMDRAINTDINQIPTNPSVISFCIYRIITCKNRSKPASPFLQYLLYKYPTTKSEISDMMVFPFIKYKTGKIKTIASHMTKNLTGEQLSIKGFIENGEQLFLFFDLQEVHNISIAVVNYKDRKQELWWALIDEICNSRKVITFPVHHSVYLLFYRNPALIYLRDDNKRLPIPKVGYYGNYYKFIPIIAALGGQNSLRGQLANTELFYFSTFRKAIRYGAWSPLYLERIAYNKQITDIDGRYYKGGVVRFALFLEKYLVPIDEAYETIGKMLSDPTKWKKLYDSLFIGSVDYDRVTLDINPEYILTDSDQCLSLSYHAIDMSTVPPNWQPAYDGYNIL